MQRPACCERCLLYTEAIHKHHIKTRGAGGGDVRRNLIFLCYGCHEGFHRGKIPRAELQAIADKREGIV